MRTAVLFIAFALAAFGQRHKLEEVDTEKPEGKMIQQIGTEEDLAKKAALMEKFLEQFPKVPATGWVLEQLQGLYVKTKQPDKVIATGDKLLALDPDDPEAALQSLKAAEAKKDVALIKKYSEAASAAARKMAATPKPADEDEVESWKNSVDYAKQVDTYTEYALYAAALESRDPKTTIELGEMLLQRNPSSEYAPKVQSPLFVAYRQSGANDKAVAIAEKVLATDQSNEDMLLVVADNYMQSKKEPEKVHAYTAKIVEVMSAKPKPEGVADAEWTARKNLVTGLAHYMNGKLYYNESRFAQADQALRSALPLIEANPTLKPEVLYLLGFANYKLDRPQDAANFYRACAAIKSPFQATAAKNLKGIQAQYTGIK
jgi:tetratricopeptide (TPR) repeat protein